MRELRLLTELAQLVLMPDKIKQQLSDLQEENSNLVINYREMIRSQLFFIQNELRELYSSRVVEYLLFPIIAHLDEKSKRFLNQHSISLKWHDLQIEFFQRSDGGEYVFSILEEVVTNKVYPQICYELALIVLKDGFLGKYYQNPHDSERCQYLNKLKKILAEFNAFSDATDDVNNMQQKTSVSVKVKNPQKMMILSAAILCILPLSIYLLS